MGEEGTCVRCGDGWPWSSEAACYKRGGRSSNLSVASELAQRLAREIETRAALGTTPISRDEVIEIVLREPLPRQGRPPLGEARG